MVSVLLFAYFTILYLTTLQYFILPDVDTIAVALDWISKVIYWADQAKGIIGKAYVNGSSQQTLTTNARVYATSLIVLPCQRYCVHETIIK